MRTFIYPAISDPPPSLKFDDQFAFQPNGSTTPAVGDPLPTNGEGHANNTAICSGDIPGLQ